MKFKCEIDMNNAAFEDNPNFELSRILRSIAQETVCDCTSGTIRDSNGNKVGGYSIIRGR